jgi:regulator of sigma E protease
VSGFLSSLEVIVRFLVVLGVVIAFHELGHFLVAKALRIKVEVFSLGFGRRLFGKKIGDTDYRVALIPLGGYVRMAGDMGEEGHVRSPRDFDAKPAWARLLVMLAGPFFSALLAVLLLTGVYMAGRETPAWLKEPPVIGRLTPDSPAAAAGLRVGDLVRSVDGVPTPTWEILSERVLTNPGRRLGVTAERGGVAFDVDVALEERGSHGTGWMGAEPCSRVLVRTVHDGTPAQAAGLVAGDAIVAVNGEPPCSVLGLIDVLQSAKDAPTRLLLERDGRQREVLLRPAWDAQAGRYVVGIGPSEPTILQRYAVLPAVRESVAENYRQAGLIAESVAKLLTGRLSVRAMSGPVELAGITSEVAAEGFGAVVALCALISLNLAIFNLLPVPILDGGRMALILVEAVRGRDLERRTKEWILQVGLVMLVALTVIVLWFDLIKRVEG